MSREKYAEPVDYADIKELMYGIKEKYNDKTAFVIKHKENKDVTYENVSFTRLLEDINKVGTALYDMGLKDRRVAVMGRNRYEWVVGHIANLLGGIISVPLDKDLQVEELESSLIRSKSDAIIFDEKYIDKIEQIKNNRKANIKYYICMSKQAGYTDIYMLLENGEKLLKEGKREYLDAKIDKDKMSILLFTSGTTDKSKAVMLSQRNITSNIYGMMQVEPFMESDKNLAFLPYHHIFSSTAILVMLACGMSTAFPDGLRYVAQNLKEYEISIFVGVPLLLEAIYNKIMQEVEKQGKLKLINNAVKVSNVLLKMGIDVRRKLFKQIIDNLGGHMRMIVSGGAPLDPKVAKGLNDFGVLLVQGYGLTETSPVISAETHNYRKAGSIGKVMPNMEIKIDNPDSNGIGEITVKGPNVMLGYYENEQLTNEVIRDGWFHTGDLGYIDKDGLIFITGRQKDMIVLKNGKKVFPEELETLVNRIDIVKESMVFGLPKEDDVKLSVKICYDKELAKEKYPNLSKEELESMVWNEIKDINKTLPKYKYIKNLIFTDEELIKTTTQKVKRNEEIKRILAS